MSCGEIARSLNRSPYGTRKAIKRLGAKPVEIRSGIPRYDSSLVHALRFSMRRANQSKKTVS